MGRSRRLIDDNGQLRCPLCERWRHISLYRTKEVIPDLTRIEDIWYEEDGKLYGRPDGYCRTCTSKKTQGPVAMAKYMAQLAIEARVKEEEVMQRSAARLAESVAEFAEMLRRSALEDEQDAMELSRIREQT